MLVQYPAVRQESNQKNQTDRTKGVKCAARVSPCAFGILSFQQTFRRIAPPRTETLRKQRAFLRFPKCADQFKQFAAAFRFRIRRGFLSGACRSFRRTVIPQSRFQILLLTGKRSDQSRNPAVGIRIVRKCAVLLLQRSKMTHAAPGGRGKFPRTTLKMEMRRKKTQCRRSGTDSSS